MKLLKSSLLIFLLFAIACSNMRSIQPGIQKNTKVVTGVENFIHNYLDEIQGKRIGLITNPSAVDQRLRATVDLFFQNPDINLTALFGPEHGIRGSANAGAKVASGLDAQTGLPVFSLYGKTRKPTAEMLKDIDVLVFDIQDVGLRTYTYIYTLSYVLEAAAENHIPVYVLDRPNPLGGTIIEGGLVKEGYFSFIGRYPLPYRYGMTVGELAKFFNSEYNIQARLTIVPMQNWRRDMFWDDTGLFWVPTSPHVPHWKTALFMPATGLIGELQSVNIGVGYTLPFEMLGAPWIDGPQLTEYLNTLNLPGVIFRPLFYTPYYSIFKGQECSGVQLLITDKKRFRSFETGLYLLQALIQLYPDHNIFANAGRVKVFNKAMGSDAVFNALQAGTPVPKIIESWQTDLNLFKNKRQKYLIYGTTGISMETQKSI